MPKAHYPDSLIDVRRLQGAQRLLLRPVLPQDDLLLAELLEGLSPEARRNRFHGTCKPSLVSVQSMCRVDNRQHLALVVIAEREGACRLVADARYRVSADGQDAEFAVLVHEHWRRQGIGSWTMQRLEQAAQCAGVCWLNGSVLAGNRAMLALMLHCGYALSPDPEDFDLVLAQRRMGLGTPRATRSRGACPDWMNRLVGGRGGPWLAARRVDQA